MPFPSLRPVFHINRRHPLRTLIPALVAALLILLAVLYRAFGPGSGAEPPPPPVPASQGGNLRVATPLILLPDHLSGTAHSGSEAAFLSAFYDPLLRLDGDGNVMPWLAQEWRQIAPTLWTVRIRDNVHFSDGTALTAETAAAALRRTLARGGSAPSPFFHGITAVRARDAGIVEIETDRAVPVLPRLLTEIYLLGDDSASGYPAGTGPFTPVATTSRRVMASAVATSWRKPQTDALTLLEVPPAPERTVALMRGDADLAIDISPAELDALRANGAGIVSAPARQVLALMLNTTRDGPLSDVRVREAISMVIDRPLLSLTYYAGAARPADYAAPQGSFGLPAEAPEPTPGDPADRARTTLQQTPWADGFTLTLSVPTADETATISLYQAIARDLTALGIRTNLQRITAERFISDMARPATASDIYPTLLSNYPGQDALAAITPYSCLTPGSWHCHTGVADMITQALAARDTTARALLTQEALRQTSEDAALIPLLNLPRFHALAADFTGLSARHGFVSYETLRRTTTHTQPE